MISRSCAAALTTALLALIAGCDRSAGPPSGPPVPGAIALRVKIIKASRQDVARKIILPASVRADSEVTLYAKVTGYLKTITKDRGDRVNAGELIARLEIPEMLSEIAHAKASF